MNSLVADVGQGRVVKRAGRCRWWRRRRRRWWVLASGWTRSADKQDQNGDSTSG